MTSRKRSNPRERELELVIARCRRRLARFARSAGPDPETPAIRDSQAFQADELLAAGERIAELLPDVDELLAGDVDDERTCVVRRVQTSSR